MIINDDYISPHLLQNYVNNNTILCILSIIYFFLLHFILRKKTKMKDGLVNNFVQLLFAKIVYGSQFCLGENP